MKAAIQSDRVLPDDSQSDEVDDNQPNEVVNDQSEELMGNSNLLGSDVEDERDKKVLGIPIVSSRKYRCS